MAKNAEGTTTLTVVVNASQYNPATTDARFDAQWDFSIETTLRAKDGRAVFE